MDFPMRRVTLTIATMALLLAACADGGGVPLTGVDSPASEELAQEVANDDVSATEGSGLDTWDGELADANDPIAHESAEDDLATEDEDLTEDTKPKPLPLPPESVPIPEPLPGITGEVPSDLLDAILADARSRLSTEAVITVIRGEFVTWPDGSLGCPEPGMSYTQALVDGYWVVLDAGGETLDYRASAKGSFKLCESSLAVPPSDGNSK